MDVIYYLRTQRTTKATNALYHAVLLKNVAYLTYLSTSYFDMTGGLFISQLHIHSAYANPSYFQHPNVQQSFSFFRL